MGKAKEMRKHKRINYKALKQSCEDINQILHLGYNEEVEYNVEDFYNDIVNMFVKTDEQSVILSNSKVSIKLYRDGKYVLGEKELYFSPVSGEFVFIPKEDMQ